MRTLFAMAAATCAVLSMGAVASAQDNVYPPRALSIVVDDDTLRPGDPFNVSLVGCHTGESVKFAFGQDQWIVDCSDGIATQPMTAPDTRGASSGVVLFADPASRIGSFTINVETDDEVEEVETVERTPFTYTVKEFPLDLVTERPDPKVPLLALLATFAGAATIFQLPRS